LLRSKCLCLATGARWYISDRQIHEDLGVSLFAGNIRDLTASFDSKLADAGKPLVRQLSITLTEGFPRRLTRKPRAEGASRPAEAIAGDGQVD